MFRSLLSIPVLITAAFAAGPALLAGQSPDASEVQIPYETSTLPDGLRVIVHEDRKARVWIPRSFHTRRRGATASHRSTGSYETSPRSAARRSRAGARKRHGY